MPLGISEQAPNTRHAPGTPGAFLGLAWPRGEQRHPVRDVGIEVDARDGALTADAGLVA
jgi:hypothetical protein